MSEQLKNHMANLKVSTEAAEKELQGLLAGKKISAARLRKHLMDAKKESHAFRSATTTFTKGLPIKTKVPKTPMVEVEVMKVEPVKTRKSKK
jgi:hypothetical protein